MSDTRLTLRCAALLAAFLWALAPTPAPAQDERGADEDAGDEPPAPSQETDISEDNYRSYMELRNEALRRVAVPTPQTAAGAGLEKMERLPDASQRHLRDQLREIITARGPWTPASMNDDFPFLPSAAARSDGALRRQEAEAWSELVAGYHAREAEIAAGRERTGAATMSGAAATAGADAAGADARAVGAGAANAAANSSHAGQPPGASAAAREDPRMNEGVSQSALEFLTGRGAGTAEQPAPDGTRGASPGSAAESGGEAGDGPSEAATPGAGGTAAAATPGATATEAPSRRRSATPQQQQPSPRVARPGPPDEGKEESALEYLAGEGGGADSDDDAPEAERGAPATLSLEALRAVPGIAPAAETKEDDPDRENPEQGAKKDG